MNVAAILSDPAYPELKRYVLEYTGLAYYADKDEDFAARISRRLTLRGVPSCAAYLSLLREPAAGRGEEEHLVGELTIGETYFFRQAAHFELLRDVILPRILERNHSTKTLRIWSAGCAIGAEPYSIGLVLQLDLADKMEGWDISILGTDINLDFLARAREAAFDEWAFRETPEAVKLKCFRQEGRRWVLRPEYRKYVSFRRHNLVSGEPVASPDGRPFDVIFCRNVTIYLAKDKVRALASQFYNSLADGGVLLVGHAEPNAEVFHHFHPLLSGGVAAYVKGAPESLPESLPEPGHSAIGFRPAAPTPVPRRRRKAPAPEKRAAEKVAARVETARALADRGEWQQAAALCREIIHADALNVPAHFTLGLVMEHCGDIPEAERALRRAIYLDRHSAMAHYHLGVCLQTGGQVTQARKAFDNVLDLLSASPDDEILPQGDGITAGELRDLTRMHIDLLGER